jgi:hypothetical protein
MEREKRRLDVKRNGIVQTDHLFDIIAPKICNRTFHYHYYYHYRFAFFFGGGVRLQAVSLKKLRRSTFL